MPRKIIKDRAIVEDTFTLVESEAALPSSGDILIDLSVWPELKDKLDNYSGNIAVKVPGDAEPEDFYLQRCGFNSFATREDRCIEDALLSLRDFTVTYQADAHEKKPIYHRR